MVCVVLFTMFMGSYHFSYQLQRVRSLSIFIAIYSYISRKPWYIFTLRMSTQRHRVCNSSLGFSWAFDMELEWWANIFHTRTHNVVTATYIWRPNTSGWHIGGCLRIPGGKLIHMTIHGESLLLAIENHAPLNLKPKSCLLLNVPNWYWDCPHRCCFMCMMYRTNNKGNFKFHAICQLWENLPVTEICSSQRLVMRKSFHFMTTVCTKLALI